MRVHISIQTATTNELATSFHYLTHGEEVSILCLSAHTGKLADAYCSKYCWLIFLSFCLSVCLLLLPLFYMHSIALYQVMKVETLHVGWKGDTKPSYGFCNTLLIYFPSVL